jgi:quercetin dioxygenase-like cupin family protein
MQSWQLRDLPVQAHQPEVLVSTAEGRAIVIELPAGDRLQEHQVHERGWLVVLDGEIELIDADGRSVTGGAGMLAHFDPNERREVRALGQSRLLLLLTPWPGAGHPSEHAHARPDDQHDQMLEDTFPSSDPPAHSAGVGGQ